MTVVGEIPADTSSAVERPLRPTFDASALPSVVFGSRVVTWWGTAGFMVAEAATLAACLAAYYYVRRNFTTWPPLRTPPPDLFIPTIGLIVLVASVFPCYKFAKAAKRLDKEAARRWDWIAVAVMLAATVLRFMEFKALNVRWDANAYGSVAWAIVFAHFTLLLVDTVETLGFAVMLQRDAAPARYYPGIAEDAFYTYFMVLSWIPCYVTVYLVPRWV
jgi:heme/copper-type cytochrome/quinol oxidase subunit 3